jgi:hypothetical protein
MEVQNEFRVIRSFNKINDVLELIKDKKVDEIKNMDLGLNVKERIRNNDLDNLYLLAIDKDLENDKTNVLNTLQRQCNGLIFEKNTNKLVAACQNKITNIEDKNEMKELIDNIKNEKHIRMEYCEDGTIMRLYNYNGEWYTATTRCINGSDSYWSSNKTFDDMFWETFNRKNIDKLDENKTYIFILLHTENRIVVRHKFNTLVYICSIDNNTMEEDYRNVFYNYNQKHNYNNKNEQETINIRRPKQILNFDVNLFVKEPETYFNQTKRGLILKIYDEINQQWDSYKYDFDAYKMVKAVRGNVPQIRMRFLELLNDPNSLLLLEYHYPEHKFLFAMIKNGVNNICKQIHKLYVDSHIKHNVQVQEDNKFYRTLRQLHAQYKITNTPITLKDVENKIFTLDKHVIKNLLDWI